MYGAIVGDIIGSSFENENHRSPYFELFCPGSRFTDDTVCTAAVADILEKTKIEDLTNDNVSNQLRLWCCTYLTRGFGSMFYQWIANNVNKPYRSYGNGALMRISPVAKFAIKNDWSLEKTLEVGVIITSVTHDHPQALNAVNAYLSILYDLLRYKKENTSYMPLEDAKDLIRAYFLKYGIENHKKIANYQLSADFDLTCNTSMGVACAAILETNNFEDVMYQVVSAGGDSDTYAAIAGAIAESIYGIPDEIKNKIRPFFRAYDEDILIAMETLYKE